VTAIVTCGNARDLALPDESVDLIVTSPPYFAQRSYQDGGEHYAGQIGAERTPAEYVDSLIECTREWLRVLEPSGSIWVNLGDKYAQSTERSRNGNGATALDGGIPLRTGPVYSGSRNNGVRVKSLIGLPWRYALRCIDDLDLILRAEVIWSKPNGLPESVKDRVQRKHEQWFHFTKSPSYFAAIDEIREPCIYPNDDRSKRASGYPSEMTGHINSGPNPLGKLPGSVWNVASQPLRVPEELGIDHFAAFPMEFPRRIILGWSPAGGVVLDPFGGTGTTALVASAHGRVGISVDLSADYCRLARWRTADPKQRERALRRPNA
jgi:site-specific DNA-methyltransferase (cytosine-N4-specific)